MWIDVLFLLFMLLAVFRGLRHGLILSVLSALAWIAGLAAAIKLSATVALLLGNSMHVSARWLPVLAFVLVFLAVFLVIRWGARLAEAALDLAMMGWLNKLGGILFYAVLYIVVLSVLLFYALQVHVVSAATATSSVTYPFIRSWGQFVIDELGKCIPFFKGMFVQLETFFGHLPPGHS
jgi:membrane protein required for colicin V production